MTDGASFFLVLAMAIMFKAMAALEAVGEDRGRSCAC